jgi:CTP:molybdopterin cytidylyltransferase MocA
MKNNVFVLLAGGKSERMGIAKGLLKHNQTYWILEQLRRISETSITEIYIGLGYDFEHYFLAIPWLKKAVNESFKFLGLNIKVVINKKPELGPFSTLNSVLKEIPKSSEILLNHIDIPILNSDELNKIILTNNQIVQPNYKGKNGHPIKMNSTFWNSLLKLDLEHKNSRLDVQIKQLNKNMISKISVNDKSVIQNLNTPKDWESYLNKN